MTEPEFPTNELRSRAVVSLRKKRDLGTHVFTFVVVNAALVVLWLVLGGGFFWPVFPILGWGVGLVFHARDVYLGEIDEDDIRREMERIS